jgi:quaternary ammonium compound-resistance protein SugE
MNWLILIVAGLLEVVWAVGLKYTDGFTKPLPSVITVIAMAASFYCLSLAMRSLPLSIAYTVWVGIGMVGAVIFGVIFLKEPINLVKIISLLLIISGILGLKLSSVT